jgi:hypothetical protein
MASNNANFLVLWGDYIGWWNISYNNRGQMGFHTRNIQDFGAFGQSPLLSRHQASARRSFLDTLVVVFRAQHDDGRALAAAGYANGVFRAQRPAKEQGLDRLAVDKLAGRARAIEIEPRAVSRLGGRFRLHPVDERRSRRASGSHQREGWNNIVAHDTPF